VHSLAFGDEEEEDEELLALEEDGCLLSRFCFCWKADRAVLVADDSLLEAIVGNHGCLCRLRNLVLLCYLSITKGLYVLRLHCMDLSLVSFTFFWVLLHAVAMVE